jgi:phosphoglycolate phosphatase
MRNILFDLDGTLIDHFTTIAKSIAYTQYMLGLPESDYATVRSTVGGSLPITLNKLCGAENVANAEPIFRAHFEEIIFDDVFALPGADWILKSLKQRGAKLGVFTNKYTRHSRSVLKHLDLLDYFDVILGTGESDCPYRKPDPIFSAYALEKMNCTSEEAVLVGDSQYDIAAAEAGCMNCYLVVTGSHSSPELAKYISEDQIFKNLYELGAQAFKLPVPTGFIV